MRRRRAALDDEALHAAEALLASHLADVLRPFCGPGAGIAGYLAIRGEISPAATLAQCRSRGTPTFVPVVRGDRLRFVSIDADTEWVTGRFGIVEPVSGASIEPMALQAVLLPLTAFDAHGNRLGMGGGFYDRCFETVAERRRQGLATPQLIGVGHAFQQVDALDPAPWDVRLDQVVTDAGALPARNSR